MRAAAHALCTLAAGLTLALTGGCGATPQPVALPVPASATVTATFETTPEQRARAARANQPVLLRGSIAVVPPRQINGGWAKVRFVVGRDGRVDAAEVVASSHRDFDDAALTAIRSWQFEPSAHARRVIHTVEFVGIIEDHYQDTDSVH